MEYLGFVPEPNCGRGTLGIIWNCLTTLFLAVWVSCHIKTLEPSSKKSWLLQKRLGYSLWVLLFPEIGVSGSIEQLVFCLGLRREMRKIPNWDRFSLKQAFLIKTLGGIYQRDNQEKINGDNFLTLASTGRLNVDDFPTDEEIDDRSKSSGVLKTISISQTLWFMVNMGYRINSNYQISLLEDMTTAHAFCGLVMFICWFRCPQDIHRPFCIPIKEEAPSTAKIQTNRATVLPVVSDPVSAVIVVVLFGIFTGIHLAAWNYPFASTPETWIWRIGSLLITVLGVFVSISHSFIDDLGFCSEIFWGFGLVLYGVNRVALVVIAFMAFRRSPAGIYDKPSWSAYWPHLG